MNLTNLDTVISFMLNKLKLGSYDSRFLDDLLLYIARNNAVTSNQDALFKRVSRTYERQFKQHGYDVIELMKLSWSCKIIPSLPEFTEASIEIKDDKIIFRSPYKKDFVSSLRKKANQCFTWMREERRYEGEFSMFAFKQLIDASFEHYEDVKLCAMSSQLIDSLSEFEDAKYWNPTLVMRQGKFYVLACTEALHETLKDIPLTFTLTTVSKLAELGVEVDSSVREFFYSIEHPLKVNLASSHIAAVEIKHLNEALVWLKELGCDSVGEYNPLSLEKTAGKLKRENLEMLDQLGITHLRDINSADVSDKTAALILFRGYTPSMSLKPMKLHKIVKCVNSEPIKIR